MVCFDQVYLQIGSTQILRGLSLEVVAGETLVLLGRSGSGKTTALRMVNAMRMPTSGDVRVEGQSTRTWDPVFLRRRIGYVIQETGLFPHRTVAENIATVPRLLGWPKERIVARVDVLLEEVGLEPGVFRYRYPASLSGGQKQRVGVARALAAEPRLMLLDEPFGALDPLTRLEMQQLFVRLRQRHGVTSLFVTHDLQEAFRVGTRIALLRDGALDTLADADSFVNADSEEAQAFLATVSDRGVAGV